MRGPYEVARIALEVVIALLAMACLLVALDSQREPPKPCPTLVVRSSTCIPFGCTKTYVTPEGEDTGECR